MPKSNSKSPPSKMSVDKAEPSEEHEPDLDTLFSQGEEVELSRENEDGARRDGIKKEKGAPPADEAKAEAEAKVGCAQTKAKKTKKKKKKTKKTKRGRRGEKKTKETAAEPSTGPRLDPLTFFSQVHSLPHVITSILDYAHGSEDWERVMDGLVEEKVKELYEERKHSPNAAFIANLSLSDDELKSCVRTMLRLELVTGFYRRPASLAVSKTWRGFMLERVNEGKHKDFAFRTKLELSRQTVLRGKKKKKQVLLTSSTCRECDAIFLSMTDADYKVPELYFDLCIVMGIYGGLDICGRHPVLRMAVEDGLYWEEYFEDRGYEGLMLDMMAIVGMCTS